MKQEKEENAPRVNNIDLDSIRRTRKVFDDEENGHHHVEKRIEGEYRLEGGGPAFTAELRSDSSSFVVSCDEPKILGGLGVHPSPLSYVLFGVLACFANTLVIQCGLKGVKLRRLKLKGTLLYDIGPVLTDIESPLIKEMKIEVESDKDIENIIAASNERCPALYLVDHAIRTEVRQAGVLHPVLGLQKNKKNSH
jgi:uncharacterized OsmC-like protein